MSAMKNLVWILLLQAIEKALSELESWDQSGNVTQVSLPEVTREQLMWKEGEVLMKNLSETLNKTLEDYDKDLRPHFFGPPVDVNLSFHIEGIPHISEVDMEFKVDFYLRQQWVDERLKFEVNAPINYIPLTSQFGEKIWYPDTFFQNEKDSFVHSATVVNGFFRWYPDGRILKSDRMTLTASCPMDLSNFPMDHQVCRIHVGSYGLPDTDVKYEWETERSSIMLGPYALELLQNFRLAGYRQRKTVAEFSTGNYTTMLCEFLLSRSISYYLIEVYIPSALVVVISWFAFFMGRDAAAERMALGVTSVLTITTLLLSTHANSPKISYVKAIDIYAGVCFVMVFLSLMQSAMVGYLLKKAKRRDEAYGYKREHIAKGNGIRGSRSTLANNIVVSPCSEAARTLGSSMYEMKILRRSSQVKNEPDGAQRKIVMCDVTSRFAFPSLFALFNALYWMYYLNASKNIRSWLISNAKKPTMAKDLI